MTEYKIVGTGPNLRIITTPANGTWLPAPLYVLAYNEGDTVAGMNTYRSRYRAFVRRTIADF